MATISIELQGSMTGVSAAAPFTVAADTTIDVLYETNRCASAWFEYVVPGDANVHKSPITLQYDGTQMKPLRVPSGTTLTLKASVQPGGYFRAHLIY